MPFYVDFNREKKKKDMFGLQYSLDLELLKY